MDPVARTLAYHEQTKHHLRRYARSLGYLDWDTQPDPFRRYAGAPVVALPLVADRFPARYHDLHVPRAIAPAPHDLDAIAALFQLALGLSAWKRSGPSRWALRCNPSSGNLHPTEGYLIAPATPSLPPGVYHYVSHDHALERRAALDDTTARTLAALLPEGGALLGLSSIHWREAWKYGERAFRYCQHDIGHALAAARYAAATLGWSARLLDTLGDARLATLLGLDRADDHAHLDPLDREHPDTALLLAPHPISAEAITTLVTGIDEVLAALQQSAWAGTPNPLSRDHTHWEIIDDVAAATSRPTATSTPSSPPSSSPSSAPPSSSASPSSSVLTPLPHLPPQSLPPLHTPDRPTRAVALITARRSAVAMDGVTRIGAGAFYDVLDRLLPRPDVPPWDAWPLPPRVHPVFFVHRVDGLAPGLYVLERSPAVHDRLRAAMHPELAWERPPACPAHLPFFLLADADLRDTSRIVSCHQDIAADGAFSLGMLADFAEPIRREGAWLYRRLFWEAGMLGHALYLEAEDLAPSVSPDEDAPPHAIPAAPSSPWPPPTPPLRATGIGCYFDDVFHEILGLRDSAFQSLYHFTVGGPVDDPRISTLPPYAHLAARAAPEGHAP
ncbi:SagB/ThcOx family dehydrogenase [Chondromyces apiculatus]|uniref:Nitroreductase domain-containing protein n=1 Tax=Chondromyces apiculatus DSM 436 TaxID=1192034 RepID=A0A017T7F1_9BACT|nr:SagB/ThcOx family dehydrogenase [Chondromyces apiculatus]EYF04922.1 Hypothetical protein CAP_3733 [Chondromyces apiculatus DSM 436]